MVLIRLVSATSGSGAHTVVYGADMVSFSDEQCPSYPVYIGPFLCGKCASNIASCIDGSSMDAIEDVVPAFRVGVG